MTIFTPTQQIIRGLSERIVKAQQPIRILDAIKWDGHIKEEFFNHQFRQLPTVNQDYYQGPLLKTFRILKDLFWFTIIFAYALSVVI